MTAIHRIATVFRAWVELARYDILTARHGFAAVSARCPQPAPAVPGRAAGAEAIRDAVALACALYWKPVRCLQRSACTVWLLRRHGVTARLVIGYRPVPFYAHAWVEVDGRVLNDSTVYQQQLQVLHIV